jgi:flagellar hook-associated protein 1 FlgK
MANISSALNYALAGLSVSATQSSLVSRNVSSAGDENYTRKTAEIRTLAGGAPMVSAISRSTDRQLLEKLLLSSSDAAGKQVLLDALNRMSATTGDPEDGQSIAASLGKLQQSLRAYETNPANTALGRDALEAARSVAAKLNAASAEASQIRAEADKALADSVERTNSLLAQFKVVNNSIVRGEGTAGDLTEALDQRDGILKQLSEELGVRTIVRPNNDVVIYAEGGAVLFEGSPREVKFTPSSPLTPGLPGNAVVIDGVAVTGADAPMPLSGGKMTAYAHVRDGAAVQFSRQLDQIAAGLIRSFSEADTSVPASLPDVEGLFLGANDTLPQADNPPAGLAAQLRINGLADPQQGGSVQLLRDGGFGGPPYVRNTLSRPGYQLRLAELADSFDRMQAFGASSAIGGTVSLKSLSIQSSAWVEATRQDAQRKQDMASVSRTRASDSLARVTGVNIDQEMAALLDLEKSYQASSKVLATVDAMLAALMEAVR